MQTAPSNDLEPPFLISLYNHKGGVGKTSTTVALGWKLAQNGNRVLLVDADPQCNLTGFLIDPGTSLLSEDDQKKLSARNFDPLERFYSTKPNCNIRTALSSVFDLQYANLMGVAPYDLPPAECYQVKNRQQLLPPEFTIPPNRLIEPPESLYLLAGHMYFGKWETQLTLACENADAVSGSQNMIGSFYQLLMRTAQVYKFDYVLIDLSPSSNTTNKVFVMSSHFLITPCSPDYFSLMAVDMLAEMLPEWNLWMQQRCAQALSRKTILLPPSSRPIFLGYTIQLYTVTNTGTKKPAQAFQRWIDRIAATVKNNLMQNLQRLGMALNATLYPQEQIGCLAMIRNYQSASPASNQAHVPVFALTADVLKTITNSSHTKDMVSDIDTVFHNFANIILKGWQNIPLVQRQQTLVLQWAIHVISTSNFGIPDTEEETIKLAIDLIRLRKY